MSTCEPPFQSPLVFICLSGNLEPLPTLSYAYLNLITLGEVPSFSLNQQLASHMGHTVDYYQLLSDPKNDFKVEIVSF